MSQSSPAVFLSYASEDAQQALQLVQHLRAAGVEVWFDVSELRGGDAWDLQIRRRIRDCALFLALLSDKTAVRSEGYFRLEWALAGQRSQMMAGNRPFIIPVILDDAPKSQEAPVAFERVQWLCWVRDQAPVAIVDRVRTLLGTTGGFAQASAPDSGVSVPSVRETKRSRWRFTTVGLVLAALALTFSAIMWRTDLLQTSMFGRFNFGGHALEKSIAVLSFVDMSENHDQGYFGDGLTDELIDLLSRNSDLRVTARTSSFYFKSKQAVVSEIAAALAVNYVLEGSVRKSGRTVRVTAQLIRANDGFHLWSDSYDRELRDVFEVQDDIAGAVVSAMKAKLSTGSPATAARRTSVPEAYDQFLIGKDFFRRTGITNYSRAMQAFGRAMDLDPGFAPAAIGYADAEYLWLADQNLLTDEKYEQIQSRLTRAIDLAPELPDGYSDRGVDRLEHAGDLRGSLADLSKALALDPDNSSIQRRFGFLQRCLGHLEVATEHSERAVKIDPLDAFGWHHYGMVLAKTHRFAEARSAIERGLQINAESVILANDLVEVRLLAGEAGDVLRMISPPVTSDARDGYLAMAEFSVSQRVEALRSLQKLQQQAIPGNYAQVARVLAWRGEFSSALEWLQRAGNYRKGQIGCVRGDPLLDSLSRDPRTEAFLIANHVN